MPRRSLTHLSRRVLAAAPLIFAPAAKAQPCAPDPTGVFVETSLCSDGPEINWTVPSGQLIFPKVFRTTTPAAFLNPVLVAAPILNAPSAVDTSAAANTDYWYWVQFEGLNSACPLSNVVGPFFGRRISLGSDTFQVPAATLTPSCESIRLDWLRIRENSGTILVRRRGPGTEQTDIATLPAQTTTFTDTTGQPGTQYRYQIFFNNTCRGQEGTPSTSPITFPPFVTIPTVQAADVLTGQSATLSASFPSLVPPVQTAQWLRNNQPVANSARISGATTTTLTINPVIPADEGIYTLRLTNLCGPVAELTSSLIVRPSCPADFDGNGSKNLDDVFIFLNVWFQNCP